MCSQPSSTSLSNADLQALEHCDTYPIRQIEHIQPHGCLLVLQQSDLTIVQVSANTSEQLGLAPEDLIGQPLTQFCAAVTGELLPLKSAQSPALGPYQLFWLPTEQPYWAYSYSQDQLILLELEAATPDEHDREILQEQLIGAIAPSSNLFCVGFLGQGPSAI